jgi:hypothetical protein
MESVKTSNFQSLKEFYPYYLTEHSNSTSKLLHFIGTTLFFVILIYSLYSTQYQLMWFMPLVGYFFAWVGHFFFEKNKPATFKYPFFSLASDFIMYFDILRGKVKI